MHSDGVALCAENQMPEFVDQRRFEGQRVEDAIPENGLE